MPQKLTAKVSEIEFYDADLCRVRFALPEKVDFQAGQFMSIAVEGYLRRSYSIGNSPSDSDFVETYVDCGPGGPGSRYFMNLEIGDKADILFPLGSFVYKINRDLPAYFFATGTGIVPFYSMIKHELKNVQSGRDLTLYYGVRTQNRIMIGDELDELAREHDNFNYHLFISRPLEGWHGNEGRFTQVIPELELVDTEIYICGGGDMITEVEDLTFKNGADKERIYYERFY